MTEQARLRQGGATYGTVMQILNNLRKKFQGELSGAFRQIGAEDQNIQKLRDEVTKRQEGLHQLELQLEEQERELKWKEETYNDQLGPGQKRYVDNVNKLQALLFNNTTKFSPEANNKDELQHPIYCRVGNESVFANRPDQGVGRCTQERLEYMVEHMTDDDQSDEKGFGAEMVFVPQTPEDKANGILELYLTPNNTVNGFLTDFGRFSTTAYVRLTDDEIENLQRGGTAVLEVPKLTRLPESIPAPRGAAEALQQVAATEVPVAPAFEEPRPYFPVARRAPRALNIPEEGDIAPAPQRVRAPALPYGPAGVGIPAPQEQQLVIPAAVIAGEVPEHSYYDGFRTRRHHDRHTRRKRISQYYW
jgi:hypothetical protein